MAITLPPQSAPAPIADDESDYGSDIDDATATQLLSQADSQPLKDVVLESIEEPALEDEAFEQRITARLSRLQASLDGARKSSRKIETIVRERRDWRREVSVEVEYDEGNRASFSRESC